MAASCSSFIPTPLANADTLGEGHPRGTSLRVAILNFDQVMRKKPEQEPSVSKCTHHASYYLIQRLLLSLNIAGTESYPSY
ncbi:hypothetical protein TNCV_371521 [Trichonephila clavipes]|nr:hypothetical protein TNCV_371521 [Trichonephila clavipes]